MVFVLLHVHRRRGAARRCPAAPRPPLNKSGDHPGGGLAPSFGRALAVLKPQSRVLSGPGAGTDTGVYTLGARPTERASCEVDCLANTRAPGRVTDLGPYCRGSFWGPAVV